jgi:chromosome segregation ATPase
MNYNKTPKKELIRLLKKSQKNETKLAKLMERVEELESGTTSTCDSHGAVTWCAHMEAGNCQKITALEAELAALKGRASDEAENAHVWQTEHQNKCKEVELLKKELDALKGTGKVPGVFEAGDRVVVTWGTRQESGVISSGPDDVGNFCARKADGGLIGHFPVMCMAHVNPAPVCQPCADKEKRIADLEYKVEVERDRGNDLLMDRDALQADYDTYKAEVTKLQSNIESYQNEVGSLGRIIIRLNKMVHGEVL